MDCFKNDSDYALLGSMVKSYLQRRSFQNIRKSNELQRKEVFKEIYTTERFYKDQLLSIIEIFLKPMMLLTKEGSSKDKEASKEKDYSSSSASSLSSLSLSNSNNNENSIGSSGGNGSNSNSGFINNNYNNNNNNGANNSSLNPLHLKDKDNSIGGGNNNNNNGSGSSNNNNINWGITENQIHAIFSHIESIYNLSSMLFDRIETRYKESSENIGDIFIDMAPFFKVYKSFSENYPTSIETLKNLKQSNTHVSNWLKQREKDPRCRSLDLASLLIAPIQRMPRYILLLEALYKVTPPHHPDWKRCSTASNILKSVVQVVNDGIHEDINRRKLIQLQSVFDLHSKLGFGALSNQNIVEPHRKLIKEGKLQKKSMRDQKIQSRLVYLCNDLFITITPLPKPIQAASINKVDKIIPLVTASIIFDSEDDLSFYLISPIKSHQFICESAKARAQWLLDIQTTILNLIESNPLLRQQRDQWSIIHQNGKWKAVSEIPKTTPEQESNVGHSIESFHHEPLIKNNTYLLNNDGKLLQQQQHHRSSPSQSSPSKAINLSGKSKQQQHHSEGSPPIGSKSPIEKDWVHGNKHHQSRNLEKASSAFLMSPRSSPLIMMSGPLKQHLDSDDDD
ncbi:pleckstrin domain-containing protein [Cavenderia fasciculata]|uniref:Pleckstrin domain-containing protein n=1 Tax=Cavenderia fasciculata TaxID=261658 RepID=F4Q0Q1_CACFS|nr:pleckstrin domain-containing protein [Cavenderia fasciculata]EGG18402.1 pleckstrin domain-containing protein [Cavenderia fasciculata]|eukprot:XP_004366306.1 pleckstrin domain-containing protein [Cavenderia fasciculata]